jgi:hypothetical protein
MVLKAHTYVDMVLKEANFVDFGATSDLIQVHERKKRHCGTITQLKSLLVQFNNTGANTSFSSNISLLEGVVVLKGPSLWVCVEE